MFFDEGAEAFSGTDRHRMPGRDQPLPERDKGLNIAEGAEGADQYVRGGGWLLLGANLPELSAIMAPLARLRGDPAI
jgi:hypothetical protein